MSMAVDEDDMLARASSRSARVDGMDAVVDAGMDGMDGADDGFGGDASSEPLAARGRGGEPGPSGRVEGAQRGDAQQQQQQQQRAAAPVMMVLAAPVAPSGVALLLSAAVRALPNCSSQDTANLAWGLAQMGLRPGQEWCGRLADLLCRRCEQLQPPHLATALWALGKLGFRPAPRQLLPIEVCLFKAMGRLRPCELSACAWAYGAMDYAPDVLWLEEHATQCARRASEFSAKDWSVSVYSMASIAEGCTDARPYLAELLLCPEMLESQLASPALPTTLAMLAYACGVLGGRRPTDSVRRSDRLLRRLLAAAQPRLHEFKGQELSALACASARLQHAPPPEFVTAWMAATGSRMGGMPGPVLCACAWALAKLRATPPAAWQALLASRLEGCLPG
jgi:hypothetical protein